MTIVVCALCTMDCTVACRLWIVDWTTDCLLNVYDGLGKSGVQSGLWFSTDNVL